MIYIESTDFLYAQSSPSPLQALFLPRWIARCAHREGMHVSRRKDLVFQIIDYAAQNAVNV